MALQAYKVFGDMPWVKRIYANKKWADFVNQGIQVYMPGVMQFDVCSTSHNICFCRFYLIILKSITFRLPSKNELRKLWKKKKKSDLIFTY